MSRYQSVKFTKVNENVQNLQNSTRTDENIKKLNNCVRAYKNVQKLYKSTKTYKNVQKLHKSTKNLQKPTKNYKNKPVKRNIMIALNMIYYKCQIKHTEKSEHNFNITYVWIFFIFYNIKIHLHTIFSCRSISVLTLFKNNSKCEKYICILADGNYLFGNCNDILCNFHQGA